MVAFNEAEHPVIAAFLKIFVAWALWIGSLTAQQWQAIAGIFASGAVFAFTALQIYVLWRDKIARYRAPGSHTRKSDDQTSPMGLQ